ncbi:MAG: hypothetical protein BGO43_04355 [Gammaproteobacteria bacterium 39-13]|nr:LysR family transcriptional regulator [Gammaproteobacteria bacterium]OJV94916.1 MAG: hypothetical protein BGO43_04355 [Gammaproteobacteria bacterium 39-13]
MKISLEALKTLETIERCGTFALAAEELHRVPSALTYTINALETQLEVKIFDRKGHRAKLTAVGKQILEEGKKLLLAAEQLEKNVKRYQSGWEEIITIAYDQVFPFSHFLFLIEAFYKECPGVELKWTGEVLGGGWDALLSNRAMIAIGVSNDLPMRENIQVTHLGDIEFVFVVSQHHPLAAKRGHIDNEVIEKQRIVAVADTSRGFLPRTSGILPGQKTLTVSTFEEKITAILSGIGVGYLPLHMAWPYIQAGKMVIKEVSKLKSIGTFSVAWHPRQTGKGTQWFIKKLSDKKICKKIIEGK